MSLVSTYVRARNGALYRNPVLVFEAGFVCFDEEEPPELVVWLERLEDTSFGFAEARALLERVFGIFDGDKLLQIDADLETIRGGSRAQRVVPGSEPWLFRPAKSFFFELSGRIPVPLLHEGEERHARRLGQAHVIDPPAKSSDARGIQPPGAKLG